MRENYKLDKIDKKILSFLIEDARQPFLDIAKTIYVSGGTIHVRFRKMVEKGIIKGSTLIIDPEKIGFDIFAFVGINLHNAKDYKIVIEKIKKIPEIMEAYYTTGKYNIFVKLFAKNTKDLYNILIRKIQEISEIQSTETLLSLETAFEKKISTLVEIA